ncbi:hypothetical protein FA10DRAFT_265140 [Acaromyces ingoldii]|uniref:Mitochondrial distribution and morphology protein 10 n=1 Tax=Acaromyces ingoldii TaxID=215250 RepID=A0A316YPW6_9BASI|nr:hypothetical protein FA10DRAFT_265140 [Acaromyces ingoldii]PWN91271.1 hypothetical protein FA10DRAFT_265140 [Acaromyces ingoldii]
MHDFVSHVLRRYWEATGWNNQNSYMYLTSTSNAVLDFSIPTGLSLSISASPSPPFFTTYRLRALPTLSGALGYIYASTDADAPPLDIGGSSRDVRFKDVVERFRVIEAPKTPQGKEPVWLAGKRIDARDYLLYGCMHVPTARVDALYTSRLSPTWQLLVTAISMPPRNSPSSSASAGAGHYADRSDMSNSGAPPPSAAASSPSTPPPGATNLQINLQRDTGRWFQEYSYSADDALWGFRFLYNFGTPDSTANSIDAMLQDLGSFSSSSSSPSGSDYTRNGTKEMHRVDEESALEAVVGGGLQGRFSVGAEVFLSAVEKSAGISTGVRFTTLPDPLPSPASSSSLPSPQAAPSSSDGTPSQPPTTITATLNPMMGHLSTAYAARMTRDIVACSRFDFNVYSYDSELTLGAEYWLRKSKRQERQEELQQTQDMVDDAGADRGSSASFPPWRAIEDDAEGESSVHAGGLERNVAANAREELAARELTREAGALSLREGPSGTASSSPATSATATAPPTPTRSWSLREEIPIYSELPPPSPSEGEERQAPSPWQSSPSSLFSSSSSLSSSAIGVLKARLSTSGIIALLWEGRLRNCLVSFGVKADLSPSQYTTQKDSAGAGSGFVGGSSKPLRAIGLDVLYFSQTKEARSRASS